MASLQLKSLLTPHQQLVESKGTQQKPKPAVGIFVLETVAYTLAVHHWKSFLNCKTLYMLKFIHPWSPRSSKTEFCSFFSELCDDVWNHGYLYKNLSHQEMENASTVIFPLSCCTEQNKEWTLVSQLTTKVHLQSVSLPEDPDYARLQYLDLQKRKRLKKHCGSSFTSSRM